MRAHSAQQTLTGVVQSEQHVPGAKGPTDGSGARPGCAQNPGPGVEGPLQGDELKTLGAQLSSGTGSCRRDPWTTNLAQVGLLSPSTQSPAPGGDLCRRLPRSAPSTLRHLFLVNHLLLGESQSLVGHKHRARQMCGISDCPGPGCRWAGQ